MLDRQDIDALLIGALYGELTPADEARLNAHLDSHPADKSALADLTSARDAVRDSRFLTVQLEPPQAVSALLLQEASRRAPAKAPERQREEGWFARFIASFARHPAMAAAAMLVLVVGVAGVMYARKGDRGQFAEQTTASPAGTSANMELEAAPSAEPASPDLVEEARALRDQAGSSFEARLEEGTAGKADKAADPGDQGVAVAKAEAAAKDAAKAERADQPARPAIAPRPEPRPTAANRTYIGVQTESPQPKDLESEADGDQRRKGASPAGAPGTASPRPDPAVATPAPPAPPPPATRAPSRGGGATTGAFGGEDQIRDNKPADEESSWAREQTTKVVNAVKANNCKEAAALAVQLSNRAPAYYQQNVENDRALKQCMTYINAERERDAERQQRARALQKRNADEAERARRGTTNSK